MKIAVACPQCQKRYQLAPEMAGKRLKCAECAAAFRVPEAAKPSAPAAAASKPAAPAARPAAPAAARPTPASPAAPSRPASPAAASNGKPAPSAVARPAAASAAKASAAKASARAALVFRRRTRCGRVPGILERHFSGNVGQRRGPVSGPDRPAGRPVGPSEEEIGGGRILAITDLAGHRCDPDQPGLVRVPGGAAQANSDGATNGANAPAVGSFDPTAPPTRYQTLIRQMVSEMQQFCDLMELIHDQATLEAACAENPRSDQPPRANRQGSRRDREGQHADPADLALAKKLAPQIEALADRIAKGGDRNQALLGKNAVPAKP